MSLGTFTFAAKLRGRTGEFALEGAVKSGFGAVTHACSNLRNAVLCRLQKFGAEFHAPFGQIRHRRFIEEMSEPVCQDCARETGLPRKACNRPLLRGIFMQKSERLADLWIASSGKPAD